MPTYSLLCSIDKPIFQFLIKMKMWRSRYFNQKKNKVYPSTYTNHIGRPLYEGLRDKCTRYCIPVNEPVYNKWHNKIVFYASNGINGLNVGTKIYLLLCMSCIYLSIACILMIIILIFLHETCLIWRLSCVLLI